MTSTLDHYLRHGRRYGVCREFWEAVADDLNQVELRHLARELGVVAPGNLKTAGAGENGHREPASDAVFTANKSGGPTGPSDPVSSRPTRVRDCPDCGRALAMRNRSGYCRTCYQRRLMRARRADGTA